MGQHVTRRRHRVLSLYGYPVAAASQNPEGLERTGGCSLRRTQMRLDMVYIESGLVPLTSLPPFRSTLRPTSCLRELVGKRVEGLWFERGCRTA